MIFRLEIRGKMQPNPITLNFKLISLLMQKCRSFSAGSWTDKEYRSESSVTKRQTFRLSPAENDEKRYTVQNSVKTKYWMNGIFVDDGHLWKCQRPLFFFPPFGEEAEIGGNGVVIFTRPDVLLLPDCRTNCPVSIKSRWQGLVPFRSSSPIGRDCNMKLVSSVLKDQSFSSFF